jgi:hypothetical protein
MLSRPTAVAVAILALAFAPAALAKGTVTIGSGFLAGMRVTSLVTQVSVAEATARSDRLHSCQAGARRSQARAANETQRKASTVACEQPPRSNLNVSNALKGAEAGAIAAGG